MADTRAEHVNQLAELIKDVEVAMFTTTGVDGRLYSRPLATQQVAFDGDLWFVITADS
ncbi:pyridoxamine 5'-phosphate oxidase family protein, partial [[Pseudomonas] hibiscicola]